MAVCVVPDGLSVGNGLTDIVAVTSRDSDIDTVCDVVCVCERCVTEGTAERDGVGLADGDRLLVPDKRETVPAAE